MKLKNLIYITFLLAAGLMTAQQTLQGSVSDESGPLPGVSVLEKGTSNGVVSDFDGNFTLVVNANPPFDLKISSVGFDTATVNVTAGNLSFTVTLVESQNLLDEVVISASRTPERLFESPVTVESCLLYTSPSPRD